MTTNTDITAYDGGQDDASTSAGFEILGSEVNSWQALLPGMANRAAEVATRFKERIEARALPNTVVRRSELNSGIFTTNKPYWLVERQLGTGTRATIAVRLENYTAEDLLIEWRHFEQNVGIGIAKGLGRTAMLILGISVLGAGLLTSMFGFGLIFVPIGAVIIWKALQKGSNTNLVGDQTKESWMLEQAVDAALREAIDLVGIAKDVIREVPKDKRLI